MTTKQSPVAQIGIGYFFEFLLVHDETAVEAVVRAFGCASVSPRSWIRRNRKQGGQCNRSHLALLFQLKIMCVLCSAVLCHPFSMQYLRRIHHQESISWDLRVVCNRTGDDGIALVTGHFRTATTALRHMQINLHSYDTEKVLTVRIRPNAFLRLGRVWAHALSPGSMN